MPATIIGGGSVSFGILAESYGVAQTFSQNKTTEITQIIDHEGSVAGAAFHGAKASVNLTVLCSSFPNLDGGDVVSLANDIGLTGSVYAQNVSINKTNTGWMSASIDGVNYPNL